MITGKIKIDVYGWEVAIYLFESPEDVDVYKKLTKHKKGQQKETDDMLEEVAKGHTNGGLTVSYSNRTTQVLIHPEQDIYELLNVVLHEKRHVEDFIIEHLNLSGGECAAYLSGFIGEKLMKIVLNGKKIS
jgi:predicted CopG family antitoxin